MVHKLKLLATLVVVSTLAGCGSTTAIQQSNSLAKVEQIAEEVNKSTTVTSLPLTQDSDRAILDDSTEVKFQDLKNAIIDDFNKKIMIIDMECQSHQVKYALNGVAPYIQWDEAVQVTKDAEAVLSEMESSMGENPDPALVFAYEQEVARLKLEFRIAELEKKLSNAEFQKSNEINKVDKLSSELFECAVRASEAKAEMERQLRVIDLSLRVSDLYDPAINEIGELLLEANYELDAVNSESFDGGWGE